MEHQLINIGPALPVKRCCVISWSEGFLAMQFALLVSGNIPLRANVQDIHRAPFLANGILTFLLEWLTSNLLMSTYTQTNQLWTVLVKKESVPCPPLKTSIEVSWFRKTTQEV